MAPDARERTPFGVLLWFGWALTLLAISGLLLPQIIAFVDFSERAPFSLLGIFMMAELAIVIFGVTVALQRKRIAHRFALGISLLPVPILAGLPPALLHMASDAAAGWYVLTIPLGLVLSIALVIGLLRPAARAYFTED
jgi:cyanate permease